MSEFVKRTLSGAVYVACVVGCILYGTVAFNILFMLICLLAVDEFHRLVQSGGLMRTYACIATAVLWVMVQSFTTHVTLGLLLALAYLSVLIITILDEIWNHSGHPLQNWGNFLISQVMIAMPLATMICLYALDKWLLLALFVLIWVNDSGAYCVGSLTAKRKNGNHKMAPHVSPKKSWEGLIGGFVFTLGAAYLLYRFGWLDKIMIDGLNSWIALLFGFLVSAFGTMGDLMESLCKRTVGVKDSGVFLPGHGGVLDRFDSILLASPVITAFCWLCYYAAPLF